jgi:splicing factor 3B subunit 4
VQWSPRNTAVNVQAIKILNMIKVFGKPIRVNKASQEKKALDVGANLFVGNLDPDVDEKMLYDTFSAFGVIVATPKIMRDPDSGALHPLAASDV